MSTLTVSAPAVKPTPAAVKMAKTFDELNALPLGAFRRWEAEYRRRVSILTGGASRTFGGSNGPTFNAAVDKAHKLVFDGYAAGALSGSCVAAAEAVLFDPINAASSLQGREAVMAWVVGATEPTLAPETDSDRTEASEAPAMLAVAEGRASVRPATMGTGLVKGLAPAEMLVVLRAENGARDEARQTTDSWDRIETAGQRAARQAVRRVLADRPRMDPIPPAPVSPIGDISPAFPVMLPALCGGSPEAEPAPTEADDFPRLKAWPYQRSRPLPRHPGEFEQQELRGSGAGHSSAEW